MTRLPCSLRLIERVKNDGKQGDSLSDTVRSNNSRRREATTASVAQSKLIEMDWRDRKSVRKAMEKLCELVSDGARSNKTPADGKPTTRSVARRLARS